MISVLEGWSILIAAHHLDELRGELKVGLKANVATRRGFDQEAYINECYDTMVNGERMSQMRPTKRVIEPTEINVDNVPILVDHNVAVVTIFDLLLCEAANKIGTMKNKNRERNAGQVLSASLPVAGTTPQSTQPCFAQSYGERAGIQLCPHRRTH
jgi:hypothetical protein